MIAIRFKDSYGLTINTAGTVLYLSDTMNSVLRTVDISTGAVGTYAGIAGQSGTANGIGTAASFNYPAGASLDAANNVLYVAEYANFCVRKVLLSSSTVSTAVGVCGTKGMVVAGATSTTPLGQLTNVVYDATRNMLYINDNSNYQVLAYNIAANMVISIAGWAGVTFRSPIVPSILASPFGLSISSDKNWLYFADNSIRKINIDKALKPSKNTWLSISATGTPTSELTSTGEFGIKFMVLYAANVSGVTFYKASSESGMHTVKLWSAGGALLASAVVPLESASGYQTAWFTTAFALTVNAVYTVSVNLYTTAGFASGVYASSTLDESGVLATVPNAGVYISSIGSFPSSGSSSNYYVSPLIDVAPTASPIPSRLFAPTTLASDATIQIGTWELGVRFWVRSAAVITGVSYYNAGDNAAVHTARLWNARTQVQVASAVFTNEQQSAWNTVMFPSPIVLNATDSYIVSYNCNNSFAFDSAFTNDYQSSDKMLLVQASKGIYSSTPGSIPTSIISRNYFITPLILSGGAPALLSFETSPSFSTNYGLTFNSGTWELGLKFSVGLTGYQANGLKFYKPAQADGGGYPIVGKLWSDDGRQLTNVTFTQSFAASGWLSAWFATPIALTANTKYRISYNLKGQFPIYDSTNFFPFAGTTAALSAIIGVYSGTLNGFPDK